MFLIRNIFFGPGLHPTPTVIATGRNCRGELGGCTSTLVLHLAEESVMEFRNTSSSETECCEWRTWPLYKVTAQDFFIRIRGTSFHIYSPLLIFFLCFIVLFLSCCSYARVFGKTLLHEFPISYSHTEWNLLSSGTNSLLWWRACYQKLNYKQNLDGQISVKWPWYLICE